MPNLVAVVNNFKAMPKKNKIILAVIAAVTLSCIIFALAWTYREQYQVLFTNLSQEDSGLIIQKLKDKKIKYKIEGEKILVPSDKVYETRIQLASHGLPTGGGIGFELFDKTDFGTTDFVQKLNYQRALQGELTRTITALTEIEQARVHLVIPEKTVFTDQKVSPSASILLKLKPGRKLTNNQIEGIVHLVSSSVEGLAPKDVTIVDSTGEMLTKQEDQLAGLSNSQLEYQKNYEKEIESRIVSILEPVVGVGKVKAKATVDLDFTKVEKTEERYDPEGQVIRSAQKTAEKSDVGGAGGVPGVNSNVPSKASQNPTFLSKGQTEKQNEVVNYEISKVVSHIIAPLGVVKRQSVAVVVDGNYKIDNNKKERIYVPRSDEEIRHYEDLVKKAIGFSQDRGDEVKVVNMAFQDLSVDVTPKTTWQQYAPIVINISKYLMPLLIAILLIFLVIKPLIRELQSEKKLPHKKSKEAKFEGAQISDEDKVSLSGASQRQLPSPKDQLLEWAKKNPENAANFIKQLLQER